MADVNSKIYGKSGATTFAIMPESVSTQIKMNDKSGAASTVDAEIVTLRSEIAALAGAMVFKGAVNAASDLPTTNYKAGWQYVVQTAGTYAGKVCEVGDAILCIRDYAAGSASNADWTVLQVNLDGVVLGPSSSVANQIATFDGTSGKLLKDSGFTIQTSVPAGAVFTDTTYNPATTTSDGLMSATDKTKVDGLEALPTKVANTFLHVNSAGTGLEWAAASVPVATTSTTGVVMVGNNLSIDASGKLDATDTTYSVATASADGLMSASDKSKLDGVEAGADVTDATNVGAAGAFMKSTDTADSISDGSTKVVMLATERTKLTGVEAGADVTDATNVAAAGAFMIATSTADNITDGSAKVLMTPAERTKLTGIETGAEENQNAVSNIKVGSTTISAAAKTDTVELAAGNGITLTPDATNKKVTVTETYYDVCVVTSEPTTPPAGLRDGGLIIWKQ